MARGPKPQPAVVKEAKGNPGKRRIGRAPETALQLGEVKAPAWLKGKGVAVWNRIAPVQVKLKLLTPADVETFARYCRNFARWLEMQDALDAGEVTYTVETASGVVHRPRPEFMIGDRLERQLLAAEDRFGLNPAERQRIYAARQVTPDPGLGLFADANAVRESDLAAKPADPAKPDKGVVGLLN